MLSNEDDKIGSIKPTCSDLMRIPPHDVGQDLEVGVDDKEVEADLREIPFTIFQNNERLILVLILSLIGWWSTVSSPIYFPALSSLSESFHVSSGQMNISMVTYFIFQGLAPTFSASIADAYGRRPILLVSILIYVAACIGIARTNAFWLLVVLRCVQAAGVAPVIAISSGIAADVCTRATRGGFVGIVSGGQVMGNGFGSIIGAALMSQYNTWRSIFVFLAIGGGITAVVAFFVLFETNRLLVGNGSIPPKGMFHRSILLSLPYFKKSLTNDINTLAPRKKLDFLSSFKLLLKPEVVISLIPSGLSFASWSMVLASIGSELQTRYHYSIMHVGLIYLPQGIACLLTTVTMGRCLNFYYRYRKTQYDILCESLPKEEQPVFNILKVRLDLLLIPGLSVIMGLIIFGWCIQTKQPVIAIIISSCMVSFGAAGSMTCVTTLLIDLSPGRGSAATSVFNLVRCFLAAAGVGALDAMVASMKFGGTYTFLGGLTFATFTMLYAFLTIYSQTILLRHSTSSI
jgi:MFS family permease